MQTSLGALGAALGAPAGVSTANANAAPSLAASHRSLSVPGIHGYAGQESVAGGETIAFHVSASARYELEICRLGQVIDNPAAEEIIHRGGVFEPLVQPIHPGSYIRVAKGLRGTLAQCALECWVRPWKIERRAGVITQSDGFNGAGYGLFAEPGGGLAFYLSGIGRNQEPWLLRAAAALALQKWHHVVASWDGRSASLWMDGQQLAAAEAQGRISAGNAPLRLAAAGDRGRASHFLDADLAHPVIYSQALTPDRIRARWAEKGRVPPQGRSVLGFWPLTEERGAIVRDASRHRRDGRIVNHATWMIGGPAFDAAVARFGSYAPEKDPQRGHGLRFAADDLYDCQWQPTYTFRVPAQARPGIYVCRLTSKAEAGTAPYHITFIVRKSRRAKKAPVLVLAATNTWRAYSGTPFGNPPPGIKQVWSTNGTTNHAGNPPAYCFYRGHAAGQGTFQLGLRVPCPVAGPYVLYGRRTDYSHLMRADRFAHAWLEQAGYPFDVIADSDLHRHPGLLRGYRVLVINGHSEYWSIPMYRGLDSYLREGGNVICLSGNSLFWRVSFDPDLAILECRKVDAPGDQLPSSRRGECWHSHDGKRGGLLRECGFPGGNLVGLETLGWNNQENPDQFGAFTVDAPEHFLFRGPHPIDLKKGDTFGTGPGGGLPRANGHEIDVRIATLAALQEKPAPPEASLPPEPEGMTRLANGSITWRIGGSAFDYFLRPVKPGTDQGAEMIYWERPAGGRVFNAGTIGAGWALLADKNFGRLLKNVLHHFGVPWLR